MRKRTVGIFLAAVAAAVATFVPWPVTGLVRAFILERTGGSWWTVTVGSARWVPARAFYLDGVTVQLSNKWKLRSAHVEIRPQFVSLLRGGLKTDWRSQSLQIEPGSLPVVSVGNKPLPVLEPLAMRGLAALWFYPDRTDVRELFLSGNVARVVVFGQAVGRPEGWIRAHGALTRPLLESMRWASEWEATGSRWEPFEFQMVGDWRRPDCSFSSGFLNFSIGRRTEKER